MRKQRSERLESGGKKRSVQRRLRIVRGERRERSVARSGGRRNGSDTAVTTATEITRLLRQRMSNTPAGSGSERGKMMHTMKRRGSESIDDHTQHSCTGVWHASFESVGGIKMVLRRLLSSNHGMGCSFATRPLHRVPLESPCKMLLVQQCLIHRSPHTPEGSADATRQARTLQVAVTALLHAHSSCS